MMYYETHAVTFSLYNFSFFGPAFQNKVRPYSYYDTYFTADQRRGGNQRNSLYSGHTATASAATFFMVKVYSDYHPEIGRKKYLLYGLASVPPLVEGYLRMKALSHFPSDILVGFVVGAAAGVAVPSLHRFKDRGIKVSMIGTPAGPGVNVAWTPMYK
jgi:membrane-associated phospholipid phosphatase